uniref:COMM domain containing 7 n=1 Tax=Gasterosteus aculeatus aculeatus TaxID=481459 RepID=A0AAQ4S3C9_GASAC
MLLHFTKDVLPDSVSTDFQNLNKLNERQFHRLIEILFQFLLEPKETERFMQLLGEFAGEHGMSAGPLKNLMKSVLLVPQGAMKKNLTAEQMKEDLLALVTVGTSEIQKVGNIFLQLKLVVRKGNSTENVYMELTLPQFYNFLHEMERAKASMECFS